MKYQVYIKKSESDYINMMAKRWNTKPAAIVREIIEMFFDQLEKESCKNGER